MIDLTAIILTKNEEKNIRDCILSIKSICKRILVIDSFSVDNTVKIAEEEGAEVRQHEFINYSNQFKFGLHENNISTKWVLRIDADERITPQAAEEIERLCTENENTDINGLILRFEVVFMQKKLRHGGIYPFRKLLVFKYGKGDIEDREMDEHIVLSEGRSVEVKYDCIHKDYKDLNFWIDKHNWYSTREVKDFFNKQQEKSIPKLDRIARLKRFIKYNIYYKLPLGTRAHLYFLYRYYVKLGFLDGREGRIFAFLQAYWYRFLVDAKIHEKNINDKNSTVNENAEKR